MPEATGISFIDILELISATATVVALIYAIKSFRKSTRIQEAVFVQNLFENFQRDRQAILSNPKTLQIAAKERGITQTELLRASIGSFDINRAYLIYHLRERKLTPSKQWVRDKKDIRAMFSRPQIQKRWESVRTRFPEDFQDFIEQNILL